MCTEIEAKLKVESHKEIIERLTGLGAEFLQEQMQTDYYFDDANRTLTETDRCLRLRRLQADQTEKVFLTYKGAKEQNRFKRRQEIEFEVEDAASAERLFSELGFQRVVLVEKKRQIWRLGRCEVALDELPLLGRFVEIEGPEEERIAEVQKDLGLAHLPHVAETYACLMAGRLHRRNSRQ
jgi:adenylate cyclase class 2